MNIEKLSVGEQRVARMLINGEVDIFSISITQLANKASVTPSMINKMCIKCGMSGWKTLKSFALLDLTKPADFGKSSKIFSSNYFRIQNFLLKKEAHIINELEKILAEMVKVKRVTILANGSTYYLAKTFAEKMNKIGFNIFIYDYNVTGFVFDEHDYVLFLSISGNIPFAKDNIKYITHNAKCSLITFGNRKNNFSGIQLAIGIIEQINSSEKPFPTYIDVLFLKILNHIIELFFQKYGNLFDAMKKLHKKQL